MIFIRNANSKSRGTLIEKIGNKIPDPLFIFLGLYIIVFLLAGIFGGYTFEAIGSDGGYVPYEIKNMFENENIRWVFSNAILTNWLGYAGGILGTILIVMFGIGLADESGLLSTSIKKIGGKGNHTSANALCFYGDINGAVSPNRWICHKQIHPSKV